MREIKFRAWNYKKMIYNVSVQNSLIMNHVKEFDYVTKSNYPIMQYTGFKDFNGKEIYEGDVLEYVSYQREENKRIEIVQFDSNCGGWYVHRQACTLADVLFEQHNEEWQLRQNYKPSDKKKVRIIGNIHENPEILK